MKAISFLLVLCCGLAASAWGASYGCQDSNGTLYFTDSPTNLPENCRHQNWLIEQQGKSAAQASSSGEKSAPAAPKTTAKPAQQERPIETMIHQDRLKQTIQQIRKQTTTSTEKYARGMAMMENASKRWHYGSRAESAKGEKLVREAQKEKHRILNELKSPDFSDQQRDEIAKQLEAVH